LGNKLADDKGAVGRGEEGNLLLKPKEEREGVREKGFLERLANVEEKEVGEVSENGEVG
jgi:hypothetical protein